MCGPYGNDRFRETYRCTLYDRKSVNSIVQGRTTTVPEIRIHAEFTLGYTSCNNSDINDFDCEITILFPYTPKACAPYRHVRIQAELLKDAVKTAKKETADFLLEGIDKLTTELDALKADLQQ